MSAETTERGDFAALVELHDDVCSCGGDPDCAWRILIDNLRAVSRARNAERTVRERAEADAAMFEAARDDLYALLPGCPECGCKTGYDADSRDCGCDAGCNDVEDEPAVWAVKQLRERAEQAEAAIRRAHAVPVDAPAYYDANTAHGWEAGRNAVLDALGEAP